MVNDIADTNDKSFLGEAIVGLIISFIVLLLLPLGLIFDIIGSFLAVAIFVPISSVIFASLRKNTGLQLSKKIAIKYGAAAIVILFVSIVSYMFPRSSAIILILGTLIYVFSDDFMAYFKHSGWHV